MLEKHVATISGYSAFDSLKLIFSAVALSLFIYPWLYWLPKSLPFLKLGETHFNPSFPIRRLSSFQAGIARKWETLIIKFKADRFANANTFTGYGVSPSGVCEGKMPDLIRFPLLVANTETKRKILQESEKMGMGIADGYPDSIDGIDELWLNSEENSYPVAKDIAGRMVTLPLHSFVREDDVRIIMQLL
jgi:hypothetical protein